MFAFVLAFPVSPFCFRPLFSQNLDLKIMESMQKLWDSLCGSSEPSGIPTDSEHSSKEQILHHCLKTLESILQERKEKVEEVKLNSAFQYSGQKICLDAKTGAWTRVSGSSIEYACENCSLISKKQSRRFQSHYNHVSLPWPVVYSDWTPIHVFEETWNGARDIRFEGPKLSVYLPSWNSTSGAIWKDDLVYGVFDPKTGSYTLNCYLGLSRSSDWKAKPLWHFEIYNFTESPVIVVMNQSFVAVAVAPKSKNQATVVRILAKDDGALMAEFTVSAVVSGAWMQGMFLILEEKCEKERSIHLYDLSRVQELYNCDGRKIVLSCQFPFLTKIDFSDQYLYVASWKPKAGLYSLSCVNLISGQIQTYEVRSEGETGNVLWMVKGDQADLIAIEGSPPNEIRLNRAEADALLCATSSKPISLSGASYII